MAAPLVIKHLDVIEQLHLRLIVTLLLAQVLDGSFTYLGISAFGRTIEANPLLNWLMATVGDGPALAGA